MKLSKYLAGSAIAIATMALTACPHPKTSPADIPRAR
jgi:hypothetical protein